MTQPLRRLPGRKALPPVAAALLIAVLLSGFAPGGEAAAQERGAGRLEQPRLELQPAVPGFPPQPAQEPEAPAAEEEAPPEEKPAEIPVRSISPPVPALDFDRILSPRQVLRIGYLAPASESVRNRDWYRAVREALLEDPDFADAARQADIHDVGLRPCEGPEDMRDRMALEEFDLVFCPALVYAQQIDNVPGPYHVVFQTRRRDEHDRATARRDEPVLHQGVLFARRASEVSSLSGDDKTAFRRALHGRDVAVSGHSDATFFYIRKKLWEDYELCRPNWLSYGTPEDAVKAVVAGLAEVGVCSEGVLSDVFKAVPEDIPAEVELNGEGNDLIRVIERTQPVPTDPVVVHERFLSQPTAPNAVGLALYEVLLDFYSKAARSDAGAPVLVPGDEEAFVRMARDIRQVEVYDW